ncbi:hypothetical protein EG68_11542 [Paragonimus skrjabini miyazakii]|uniref:Cytosolic endo-beta-N-acetylglucosaminidase TIM barrel domain-containing protein n=1 Tax=Paragonimus skrjabini miyazakii TaxID=59628 RepID=A0A8S9YLI3_9TREM|nr:hypothetical protein EG68_11542 [Paragonimus skrjabini miyazakii]
MRPTAPIRCLEELLEWKPDPETQSAVVPLHTCCYLLSDDGRFCKRSPHGSQVLYCHDMAGNYLESDRFHAHTSIFPAFRFTRWHLIDIFVYFSHHTITLPPISWINLAHRYAFPGLFCGTSD